jgi:two-component system sensor histidine kinase FlrB
VRQHPNQTADTNLAPFLQTAENERLADRLQTLLNALPAGVVVLDGDGKVQDCNPAAREMLGEPLCAQPWNEIVIRSFQPGAGMLQALTLQSGRLVTLSTCPLGREPGQIILLQDVTLSHKLNQTLEQSRRLVSMGRMAASLAHQIRTPLSSALLYASQLCHPQLSAEKLERFAEKTVASLKGVEQLINNMLAFSRGGPGEQEIIEPMRLLQTLVRNQGDPLLKGNTRIEIVNEVPQLLIRANRTLLQSALQNLLNNALQAIGEEGGCIELEVASRAAGSVDLIVRDNGTGISESRQREIFEPFETNRAAGTGLGLAVVRSVAQAHQGEVLVESVPGQGSSFAIRLPAIPAASKQAEVEPVTSVKAAG